MQLRYVIGAVLVAATPAAAQAQETAQPDSLPVVRQLYECRAIADPAQRLACFDRQVAALETAESQRDIRIVDREQVRETRRGLFGLSLSGLNLFGDRDEESGNNPEQIESIDSTIVQTGRTASGGVILMLENQQRWVQIGASPAGRGPRVGESITIRRAALGSYMASVSGRSGIRVRREQ